MFAFVQTENKGKEGLRDKLPVLFRTVIGPHIKQGMERAIENLCGAPNNGLKPPLALVVS